VCQRQVLDAVALRELALQALEQAEEVGQV
jgi:hypothetical protein